MHISDASVLLPLDILGADDCATSGGDHCSSDLIILLHLIPRVLVRISHRSVNNLLVEPRPMFSRSCEPEEYGNDDDKSKDREGVVEIIPSDRKVLGKAEDHHHPSGIDQCKDIDWNAVCSQRPTSKLNAVDQSSP